MGVLRAVPLQLVDGQWVMNMQDMTEALTSKTRMVCIANPQNPTGRCYSLAELQALAATIGFLPRWRRFSGRRGG